MVGEQDFLSVMECQSSPSWPSPLIFLSNDLIRVIKLGIICYATMVLCFHMWQIGCEYSIYNVIVQH